MWYIVYILNGDKMCIKIRKEKKIIKLKFKLLKIGKCVRWWGGGFTVGSIMRRWPELGPLTEAVKLLLDLLTILLLGDFLLCGFTAGLLLCDAFAETRRLDIDTTFPTIYLQDLMNMYISFLICIKKYTISFSGNLIFFCLLEQK